MRAPTRAMLRNQPCTDPIGGRMQRPSLTRRAALQVVALSATTLALPALATSRRAIARMTDGPFYPPRTWRERWTDWDADLTRVQHAGGARVAKGEHLGL